MGDDSVASTQITAGLGGFIVLFCLALACWFLFRSMSKRLRGVQMRENREQAEQAQHQQVADEGQQPPVARPGHPPAPPSS